MSNIRNIWLERVDAPVMGEGLIRQFKNAVWPLAHGYPPGGFRTNLTVDDAWDIWVAFERRVKRDGGPLVCDEQADKGREYLARYAKRLSQPTDIDYRAILDFRFRDVRVADENLWRIVTAPVYRARWADGRLLDYWVGPWTAGNHLGSFYWHKEAA